MRKNSLYIISSFFFACILFIYATLTNYQNSNSARQVRTETYTTQFLMSQLIFSMTVISILSVVLHLR